MTLVLKFIDSEAIAFMTAFRVLSNAVNCPAGLNEPATVVLPLLAQRQSAVIARDYSYMLSFGNPVPIAASRTG